jgi:hypothetical protein
MINVDKILSIHSIVHTKVSGTDLLVSEGRKYGTQFEIRPSKLGQSTRLHGPTSYQCSDQPAKLKVVF